MPFFLHARLLFYLASVYTVTSSPIFVSEAVLNTMLQAFGILFNSL